MKKEFKAESKQLLELMINSIYSNKDIFLRELISNASDAIDKKEFLKIQGQVSDQSENKIRVAADKEARTITITDTGIGMDEADLEQNLGTIAHSGSKEFLNELVKEQNNIDIIGQFGVGFYASFIVADKVSVKTHKEGAKAYLWESEGVSSYEITECDYQAIGTEITLHVKDGEDYDKYLDTYTLENLITTHSNYVKYPVELLKEVTTSNEEDPEAEAVTVTEYTQVNTQVALWKKDKADITDEEYNEFYQSQYYSMDAPLKTVHVKSEGVVNNNLLLFIPKSKTFDYMTPNYKPGIDLYSKGILIDRNIDYLVPEYFNFVKGLVDSEDLTLNISREMLQKDRHVEKIQQIIEKQIKKALLKEQKKNREAYSTFYDEFGRTLMFGVYDKYGMNARKLEDLIMFKTNKSNGEYKTLAEYLSDNENTDAIYYIAGSSIEAINAMPIMEKAKTEDIEILYCLNDVDEFGLQAMRTYQEKELSSILNKEFGSNDEKEELEQLSKDNTDVLDLIKEALNGKVVDVVLTNKLVDSAACIVNKEDISIEQEKVLKLNPENDLNLEKVLEINPKHEIFKQLKAGNNVETIAKVLYNQALLVEGLPIDDPKEYTSLILNLIK